MTSQELQQSLDLIKKLQAENEALKAQAARKTPSMGLKVSEKGALSVYGLGRFPVTLYKGQWKKLIAMAKDIESFIQANDSKLASKE